MLIPVHLTVDGGEAGSNSPLRPSTYTYTATTIDGLTVLGQNLVPLARRPSGRVTAATHGSGFRDAAGNFCLFWTDETLDATTC